MSKFKLVALTAAITLSLSGCELLSQAPEPSNQTASNAPTNYDINTMMLLAQQQNESELQTNSRQFKPYQHYKTLGNYVEQMALDIADTMQQESELGIAVTSFVDLNESLKQSNQLGNQVAETLYHQLQKFGYGVIDFKTRDSVVIDKTGDFVFSRDINELTKRRIASHVLAGTLIYRPSGVEVNARVINLTTKQVVATSNKVIPYFVLQNESIQSATAQLN